MKSQVVILADPLPCSREAMIRAQRQQTDPMTRYYIMQCRVKCFGGDDHYYIPNLAPPDLLEEAYKHFGIYADSCVLTLNITIRVQDDQVPKLPVRKGKTYNLKHLERPYIAREGLHRAKIRRARGKEILNLYACNWLDEVEINEPESLRGDICSPLEGIRHLTGYRFNSLIDLVEQPLAQIPRDDSKFSHQ